jgi:hypothetical protein
MTLPANENTPMGMVPADATILNAAQDGDAHKGLQNQKVLIARGNQTRLHCKGAGQDCIVVRVAADGLWQGWGNDQIAD